MVVELVPGVLLEDPSPLLVVWLPSDPVEVDDCPDPELEPEPESPCPLPLPEPLPDPLPEPEAGVLV